MGFWRERWRLWTLQGGSPRRVGGRVLRFKTQLGYLFRGFMKFELMIIITSYDIL